jgi:hypothetical protein
MNSFDYLAGCGFIGKLYACGRLTAHAWLTGSSESITSLRNRVIL